MEIELITTFEQRVNYVLNCLERYVCGELPCSVIDLIALNHSNLAVYHALRMFRYQLHHLSAFSLRDFANCKLNEYGEKSYLIFIVLVSRLPTDLVFSEFTFMLHADLAEYSVVNPLVCLDNGYPLRDIPDASYCDFTPSIELSGVLFCHLMHNVEIALYSEHVYIDRTHYYVTRATMRARVKVPNWAMTCKAYHSEFFSATMRIDIPDYCPYRGELIEYYDNNSGSLTSYEYVFRPIWRMEYEHKYVYRRGQTHHFSFTVDGYYNLEADSYIEETDRRRIYYDDDAGYGLVRGLSEAYFTVTHVDTGFGDDFITYLTFGG